MHWLDWIVEKWNWLKDKVRPVWDVIKKVFIILGMIFQFYFIFPLVLGAIALKKLKTAEKADDISIGWKIVILLFVNVIAGIILLVMKDADYTKA